MRKVVSYLFISLDGVVEAPELWVFDHFDAEMTTNENDLIGSQDAVLLGRVTYEGWASYWPTSNDEPFATFINSTPKYVASTTFDKVTWEKSTLIEGSVADEIARLKAEPGKDIGVHGSPLLVRSLLGDDLVDELRLAVVPVIAGTGQRLFADRGELRRMELTEAQRTSSGVMLLSYRPRAA